jgi:hypothetical protein
MTIATVSLSVNYISIKLLLDNSTIKAYEITYWQGLVVAIVMIATLCYL